MIQTIKYYSDFSRVCFIKRLPAGVVLVALVGALSFAGGLALASQAVAKPKGDEVKSADRIVAIVDDDPVSEFEVTQRMKLVRALGNLKITDAKLRENVLKRLVDERLQAQEAKRLKIKVTKKQIENTITNMAGRAKQTLPQIKARLSKRGVNIMTFEAQVRATIAWNAVIRRRFSSKVSVDQEAVQLKFADLKKRPIPGQKLLVLRQITLPFERGFPGTANTRRRDAMQVYRRFKGCGSLKRIASEVFNVHVSPARTVPLKALNPQFRKILRKMGPGRITPPSLAKGGITLLAYCSNKEIKAPEITLKQVENQLVSQQYGLLANRHMRDLRRDAIVEYR